ncbi:hypothetical protein KR018_008804 [Drosophila ironensis]|nr:hypothetical protein KR018_008804 [Drosophila ironensis]
MFLPPPLCSLQTLAILLCACLVGTCHGNYGGYGGHGGHGGYGQEGSSGAASAASSSAAASGNEERRGYERPVEIIAGGHRGGYGQEHEVLRPIHLGGGYGGHGGRGGSGGFGGHGGAGGFGGHGGSGGRRGGYGNNYNRGGYGPRWTVQPAGATLLYPGQNHYRAYVSPPEYSKVVLPIRAAAPVAKLFVPEHEYGNQYGGHQGGYRQEGPRGY